MKKVRFLKRPFWNLFILFVFLNVMHSVQSLAKQTQFSGRQRRRHFYNKAASGATAAAATNAIAKSTAYAYKSTAASSSPRYSGYKIAKAYRNTVPILVHGIVVSNLSLVLLQKEYIEQFYFEKRSGGGGPDPDAHADSYRHLNAYKPHYPGCSIKPTRTACSFGQLLRFG